MNIYDFFKEYDKKEINEAINELTKEERKNIKTNGIEMLFKIKCKLENNRQKFLSLQQIDSLKKNIYFHHYEKDIKKEMNISHNDFLKGLNELEKMGTIITRNYLENGAIKYGLGQNPEINNLVKKNIYNVRLNHIRKTQNIKFLAMSDLHFGSIYERLDLVDKVFEYCTKNNIHIILNCGDFINGIQRREYQKILYVEGQIEHFLNKYPYDRHILTFGVMGNHDFEAYKYGISLSKACYNNRPDIIIADDDCINFNYQKESIFLSHGKFNANDDCNISLYGHYHKFSFNYNNNCLKLDIPTLSDMTREKPSIVLLDVYLNNGIIENLEVKNVDMTNGKSLSRLSFDICSRKK